MEEKKDITNPQGDRTPAEDKPLGGNDRREDRDKTGTDRKIKMSRLTIVILIFAVLVVLANLWTGRRPQYVPYKQPQVQTQAVSMAGPLGLVRDDDYMTFWWRGQTPPKLLSSTMDGSAIKGVITKTFDPFTYRMPYQKGHLVITLQADNRTYLYTFEVN